MIAVNNAVQKVNKRKGLLYHLVRDYDQYLMLAPGLILLAVFAYVPLYGITIAFQNFNIIDGYFGSKFVGFKHFILFFKDPYFARILTNTVLIGVYRLLWGFWPPIVFALLLNELKGKLFKRSIQSISYLPHFVSSVILVGLMFDILKTDGVVNNLLVNLGLEKQQFFINPAWFRTLYIGSGIWQELGWNSIIYLAALTGLSYELFEAANIDGATRFQKVRYITIPGIMPTIVILFILNVKSILSVGFDKVFLMYNEAVYSTADVIATYVYRRGIEEAQYSYSAAVGLFESLIALGLLVITNKIAKKLGETSLW